MGFFFAARLCFLMWEMREIACSTSRRGLGAVDRPVAAAILRRIFRYLMT